MPLTLYGYILGELLKLLLIITAVLVVVMSFGFAIKPVTEGLLEPLQLVRVVIFAMPGMLVFVLPIAAALSGTLVFFRLTTDNEITACAATGISYRELLLPVIALGLALTLSMFVLSNWVVPRFWRLAAHEIEQDVAAMVVRQIQRREVVKWGRMVLYADSAIGDVPIEKRPPDQPTPYRRMVLEGVAVGRLDDNATTLRADYTADRAVVDLYRDPAADRIYATMMLWQVTVDDPETGLMVAVDRQPIEAQEIPRPFMLKPKFLSLPHLKRLQLQPERDAEVRQAKSLLAMTLARNQLSQYLATQLADHSTLSLLGPRGETYLIRTPAFSLHGTNLRLAASDQHKIEVRVRTAGLISQRLEADAAELDITVDEINDEPRLKLLLKTVAVHDPSLPRPSSLKDLPLPLLRTDQRILAPLHAASIAELHPLVERYGADPARAWTRLNRQITSLMRDIASRLHERAAMSVNCLLVLLLAAVMSMKLRGHVPLAIFFWCFLPTVLAYLLITSGQNMIKNQQMPLIMGIAMAWSGNAGLLLISMGVYLRLRRN